VVQTIEEQKKKIQELTSSLAARDSTVMSHAMTITRLREQLFDLEGSDYSDY
jgi:polyhydroxyalkanoate synthesis regulator phasin